MKPSWKAHQKDPSRWTYYGEFETPEFGKDIDEISLRWILHPKKKLAEWSQSSPITWPVSAGPQGPWPLWTWSPKRDALTVHYGHSLSLEPRKKNGGIMDLVPPIFWDKRLVTSWYIIDGLWAFIWCFWLVSCSRLDAGRLKITKASHQATAGVAFY